MNYDSIDLDWEWDGDYLVDGTGDIQDTSDDLIRAFENEMRTIIKSEIGDWKAQLDLGSSLHEFVGQPNTKELGGRIEQQVVAALTRFDTVAKSDLSVRAVPVHRHILMLVISVNALATRNNRLGYGDRVQISVTYDTQEDGIFFLAPNDKNMLGGR